MSQGITIKGQTADGRNVAIQVDADGRILVTTGAVELMAWDATDNILRRVEIVESTINPGHYVLAVGNSDGTPISGGTGGTGGTVPGAGVDNLLLNVGENLLLSDLSVLLI